jgi:hypothetical protein
MAVVSKSTRSTADTGKITFARGIVLSGASRQQRESKRSCGLSIAMRDHRRILADAKPERRIRIDISRICGLTATTKSPALDWRPHIQCYFLAARDRGDSAGRQIDSPAPPGRRRSSIRGHGTPGRHRQDAAFVPTRLTSRNGKRGEQ